MTFRILSLDGGGTWAVLQAMALEDLYPGRTGRQILANYDLVVANSGGSIVLAGLMLDYTPTAIRAFFEDARNREAIFYKKPWIEEILAKLPIFPRYEAAQKRVGLGNVFGPGGDTALADWPQQPGWPTGPRGEAVRVLIMAFDYDGMREDLLRTYGVPATGAEAEAIALVDAVHASSNAPVTYFDAPALANTKRMPDGSMGGMKRFWDGAMGGYNNPLMAGVVDALALGVTPGEIRALTIGTGTVRLAPQGEAPVGTPAELVAPVNRPGPVADAGRAAGCINDDPPDAATFTAHVVLGNPGGTIGRVVRMNPVVQPVRDAAGRWTCPPGLTQDQFDDLAKLDMDAVEPADVALILTLGRAWLADTAPNQPIRMGDDLTCRLGHAAYSHAKAYWATL